MASFDKLRAYKVATINPNTMSDNYVFGPGGGFFRSRHTGDVSVILLDGNSFTFGTMSDGLLVDWIAVKAIVAGSASTSIEVYHLSA